MTAIYVYECLGEMKNEDIKWVENSASVSYAGPLNIVRYVGDEDWNACSSAGS